MIQLALLNKDSDMLDIAPLRDLFDTYASLCDSDWEELLQLSKFKSYLAGEHIFHAGDITTELNFVIRG